MLRKTRPSEVPKKEWLPGALSPPNALRYIADHFYAMIPTSSLLIPLALLISAMEPAQKSAERARERYEFTEAHMGMPFKLIFYAADDQTANQAARAAFNRIAELNRIMSDYHPDSELNRLSRGAPHEQPVPVSDDLWQVLQRAQHLAVRTQGAFDVTVGPYTRLWRRARRQREFPSQQRMEQAREATGYENLRLDEDRQAVQLLRPGMRLDLGGIAVGYAIDEALEVLREHGITRALVDASGDIVVGEAPPGTEGWRVGIARLDAQDAPPSRIVSLENAAVTTSGDAWQYVELGGKRYSHIVDPRTGLGLTNRSSVTVLAPDGLTADTLATAVSVLGPEKGLELIDETPGAAAIVVQAPDGAAEVYESKRLEQYRLEPAEAVE